MRTSVKAAAVTLAALLGATACGGAQGASDGPPEQVTIAVGSGIAYSPLTIMKHERMLETRFPETKFVWREGVTGGAATRDGMLSDQIQVGVAGIAPYLVGFDRGVDWKVLGSMSQLSIDLVTLDPSIKSLKDLAESGRPISLPSPDSGQAIALKALGEQQLGDPTAFDEQLAPMGHPEAFQALISGTTGAAFIGPPFQFRLIDEHGARRLASASDVFGTMTYSAIVLMQDFYDQYPGFSRAVFDALEEALTMLRERPAEAAKILSTEQGGSISPEQYQTWIEDAASAWTSQPAGYLENARFMQSVGLISEAPESAAAMMLPTVRGGGK